LRAKETLRKGNPEHVEYFRNPQTKNPDKLLQPVRIYNIIKLPVSYL